MRRLKVNTIFLFAVTILFSITSIGYSALSQAVTVGGDVSYDPGTLYNVFTKSSNSSYVREYTLSHQDSLAGVGSSKIYYWYASNDSAATTILDKFNVVFGGFCWEMVRTTDTGGVKMIYNGVPNNGQCRNPGTSSTIGNSIFNSTNNSVADVGYMNNLKYVWSIKSMAQSVSTSILTRTSLSTSYWYADSISYDSNTGSYSLVNPYQVSSSSDYPNLEGKYTFFTTYTTGKAVKYIASVGDNNIAYIELTNGNLLSYYNDIYVYGDDYVTNSDGTYSISNPTTMTKLQYAKRYNEVLDKFICKNPINNKCDMVGYVYENTVNGYKIVIQNTYKFARGFTYTNGKYYLNGTDEFIYSKPTDTSKMKNAHYSCFDLSGECTKIFYVYYHSSPSVLYVQSLTGGHSIEDILNNMLNVDDVNTNDSVLKTTIENWYEQNLLSYESSIEDVIYCNSRVVDSYSNQWNPNGGAVTSNNTLFFSSSLNCDNTTDAFSVSNTKAKLKYPVGLMSSTEMRFLNNSSLLNIGKSYWLMNPEGFAGTFPHYYVVYSDGRVIALGDSGNPVSYAVRPAISLKPGTRYTSGDGSKANPYVIQT